MLRALDEQGERGQAAGLEFPRDFDRVATQQRFERLAARLSDVFGCPLVAGKGPYQDASLFGEISIPPEFTATRAKRSRARLPVIVSVSNFGNLASCRSEEALASPTRTSPAPPVHREDWNRVEGVLNKLQYQLVPTEFLESTYDGPNRWVFGDREDTWFVRYFSYL